MRIFLAVGLLLAASASAFRTDNHMSEDEFELKFGGHTDDADLEQRKAQALAVAEDEINTQNLAFEHGESSFFEDLNADSDKPREIFEKEKFGAFGKDEVRGLGAFDRTMDDPERVDPKSEAFLQQMMEDARTNRQTAPTSFDSRSYGYISPVKNQQQCGSCAAFSSVATIETGFYRANGGKAHTDFAEQTLLDAGYNGGSMNGCNGAYPEAYLQRMTTMTSGSLPHEYSDPYRNTNPYLKNRNIAPLLWGAKVSDSVYTYSCNETYMKQLIYQFGAVVAELNASGPGFSNYGGGIYAGQCVGGINHAVTAVGYGVDPADRKTFFIVKNSWGTGWGEGGFFRIKPGTCAFGTYCAAPKCTYTGQFSAEPQLPKTTTCDVTGRWGVLNGNGYSISVDGTTRTFNCVNGSCSPAVSGQANACMYICGQLSCSS